MFERLMKQAVMNRVLYALAPLLIFAVYLFGWRVLAVVLVANIAAYITEYLFIRTKKAQRSLWLPLSRPLW